MVAKYPFSGEQYSPGHAMGLLIALPERRQNRARERRRMRRALLSSFVTVAEDAGPTRGYFCHTLIELLSESN
jgi:hypothetical protein